MIFQASRVLLPPGLRSVTFSPGFSSQRETTIHCSPSTGRLDQLGLCQATIDSGKHRQSHGPSCVASRSLSSPRCPTPRLGEVEAEGESRRDSSQGFDAGLLTSTGKITTAHPSCQPRRSELNAGPAELSSPVPRERPGWGRSQVFRIRPLGTLSGQSPQIGRASHGSAWPYSGAWGAEARDPNAPPRALLLPGVPDSGVHCTASRVPYHKPLGLASPRGQVWTGDPCLDHRRAPGNLGDSSEVPRDRLTKGQVTGTRHRTFSIP